MFECVHAGELILQLDRF